MKQSIAPDVIIGSETKVYDFVNLYGCEIGDHCIVGTFVEVQRGAKVGSRCKISSHSFICEGVTIEDEVFVGHGVTFINDRYPHATNNGELQTQDDWELLPTLVKRGASIGSNATILCGLTIGEGAIVGAGSVVTQNVPAHTIVAGNPARVMRSTNNRKERDAESMIIPPVDLGAQYRELKNHIDVAFQDILNSGVFILGPHVEAFEEAFASYCTVDHAIGVNSGTSALHLAMLALGIGPGDEVITCAHTFIATIEAIAYTGAKPILVDATSDACVMDVAQVESAISPNTRAIIPVHLYGQPVDMDPLIEIAQAHELAVIEDAAQAHGSTYKGRKVGSLGTAACFSFYPTKNLGAYGEAGAVVTNDPEMAQRVRHLRSHGESTRYHHDLVGYNNRMSALQGAVLNIKLPYLDEWNAQRRHHATAFTTRLTDLPLTLPIEVPYAQHVYHLYVVQADRRDELYDRLRANKIIVSIHYPIPVHLTPAFAYLGYEAGSFPVAEHLAKQVLSLPLYPEMTIEQIERITAMVHEFFDTSEH
jgi:dTDP-4-amino-4,6-dideoxygalactose transaminase/acetyltransferase-like isoleucine patch superfamily enzyme